jgi:hypothetical protein
MPLKKRTRQSDNRSSMRFRVSAPVIFTWSSAAGGSKAEGVTRDVSTESLFIWARDHPPEGSEVHCRVFLPSTRSDSVLKVDWTGPIVRMEYPPAEHNVFGFVVVSRQVPELQFST